MNEMVNQLAQSLFKKNSLEECSRWELEILADKFPYFGIAQFMLAGKLKEENDEAYKKQIQKTSLYFNNPLWLDYTLNNTIRPGPESSTIATEPDGTAGQSLSIVETTVTAPGEAGTLIADELVSRETKTEEDIQQEASSGMETEAVPPKSEFAPDEASNVISDDPLSGEIERKETRQQEVYPAMETEAVPPKSEFTPDEASKVISDDPLSGEIQREEARQQEVYPAMETEAVPLKSEFIPGEASNVISDDPLSRQVENEESTPGEAGFAEEAVKIAPLKMEPVPDENATLEFQAFHTVDYFASQGIKLKTEDIPKDRFGQQLKSFTEWLKTLKKVPASEIVKEIDKGTEQKVITLAEHSVENREIVTETMAEVWVKQGNREKALEVYNKLSLQNPAKSSYFASLIEQLKNQ